MEFAVSRAGTTLVTLHGGSDTTACDDATADLAERLESLAAAGTISDWEITAAEVEEHPTAPFDPYTIAVEFEVVVTVEAADADEALDRGANEIHDRLTAADVDGVSYTSSPSVATV